MSSLTIGINRNSVRMWLTESDESAAGCRLPPGLEPERSSPRSGGGADGLDELPQRARPTADDRVAMREQEVVGVQFEQQAEGGEQPDLHRRWVLPEQEVRDEAERAVACTDEPVRERERPVRGKVERALLGADRADLAGDGPARQLRAEVEALDRFSCAELLQPG